MQANLRSFPTSHNWYNLSIEIIKYSNEIQAIVGVGKGELYETIPVIHEREGEGKISCV